MLEAGVVYAFLGVDSVVEKDLILFNKGYTSDVVYKNLDLLLKLGYSIDVDSKHRLSVGYITWQPYSTIEGIKESVKFFKMYNNTPKLIQHELMLFSSTPLMEKIKSDGLLVSEKLAPNEFTFNWKFKDKELEILYRQMLNYFAEWSPIRDGIRTLEKFIYMESPNLKGTINDLVIIRKKLDKHFYEFFDMLLMEYGGVRSRISNITKEYIHQIEGFLTKNAIDKIDRFCIDNGFETNIVDGIREKQLWLCRYRS